MHHNLDIKPNPEKVLYINEPWLIDPNFDYYEKWDADPDPKADNVRVYVPLDLNADAIMMRLRNIVARYTEANETNESDFSDDVKRLVYQIEIYDQVWFVRGTSQIVNSEISGDSKHSKKAVELVKRFVEELEEIPDGCAELFPFELIDELKTEYGIS